MICPKCHATIDDNSLHCPACGLDLTKKDDDVIKPEVVKKTGKGYFYEGPNMSPSITSHHSKTKAALLAFFLGFLGIHNFYLGHISRGSGQLIFSILIVGLPFSIIWALVDFILILIGKYKTADGQPLE